MSSALLRGGGADAGYDAQHGAPLIANDHLDVDLKAAARRPRGGAPTLSRKARAQLVAAMVLCFLFMIGEVVGGYFAGSLAIMTE